MILLYNFYLFRLPKSLETQDKSCIFLQNKIADALAGSGYSVDRLSVPYVPQPTGKCMCYNL